MTAKEIPNVIKAYEDAINQNRIVGSQCDECNEISVPPRPVCRNCGSDNIEITTINPHGKLLTWTVIHIAPPTHIERVPYTLGIVEMDNGQRLTGIVDLREGEDPQFDMELIAGYEEGQEGATRLRWRKP